MKPSRRNRRTTIPALTPEEQKERDEKAAAMWAQFQAEMEAEKREQERVESVLKMLDIPFDNSSSAAHTMVSARALVDILMDDKKAQAIFSKLKNKAFW